MTEGGGRFWEEGRRKRRGHNPGTIRREKSWKEGKRREEK
jgi:hypothetical protein